jgi:hypothetical protein
MEAPPSGGVSVIKLLSKKFQIDLTNVSGLLYTGISWEGSQKDFSSEPD